MQDVMFWVPASANIGVGLSILTCDPATAPDAQAGVLMLGALLRYNNDVRVGVSIDEAIDCDPRAICVAFEQVVAAAARPVPRAVHSQPRASPCRRPLCNCLLRRRRLEATRGRGKCSEQLSLREARQRNGRRDSVCTIGPAARRRHQSCGRLSTRRMLPGASGSRASTTMESRNAAKATATNCTRRYLSAAEPH
jgi:hypothetical protein